MFQVRFITRLEAVTTWCCGLIVELQCTWYNVYSCNTSSSCAAYIMWFNNSHLMESCHFVSCILFCSVCCICAVHPLTAHVKLCHWDKLSVILAFSCLITHLAWKITFCSLLECSLTLLCFTYDCQLVANIDRRHLCWTDSYTELYMQSHFGNRSFAVHQSDSLNDYWTEGHFCFAAATLCDFNL